MRRFADVRTKQVYETGAHKRIPKHICRSARWKVHLLLAAHDLHDVGVISKVARWSGVPGLLGLHIHGKWFATFQWHAEFGAVDIKLERR